jgi:hypothetical protein
MAAAAMWLRIENVSDAEHLAAAAKERQNLSAVEGKAER